VLPYPSHSFPGMLRILLALSGAVTLLISLLGRQGPSQPLESVSTVRLPPPGAAAVAAFDSQLADRSVLAVDNFSQAALESWPPASTGGDYILFGPTEDFNVSLGQGLIRTPAGEQRGAILNGVRARDVDVLVRVEADHPPEGGNQFVYVPVRRVDNATDYLARVRLGIDDTAWLQFAKNIDGATQLLGEEARLAVPVNATQNGLWVRASASGSATATLALKAWPDGSDEPDRWQYVVTDTEPRLSNAGGVGLQTYVSARASSPVLFGFSDLRVMVAALNTPAVTVAPSSIPQAAAAPTPAPTLGPTPVITSSPPTAADAWQTLQPELDAAWGHDTPRTVALLDQFVSRFPDDQSAREKLYAALVASGEDLLAQGNTSEARAVLERARALIPTRGEAGQALARLTPPPTPVPEAARQDVVTPVPPPRRAAPAPPVPASSSNVRTVAPTRVVVAPVAPARSAPPPTPTKVPFTAPAPGR
jgi:hypothetical protein